MPLSTKEKAAIWLGSSEAHGGNIYLDMALFEEAKLEGDKYEGIFKAFHRVSLDRARQLRE